MQQNSVLEEIVSTDFNVFEIKGTLLDYLMYFKITNSTNIEQTKRLIIAQNIGQIFNFNKIDSLSIVGSTIYGQPNSFRYKVVKPNFKSDLDLQVVCSKFNLPKILIRFFKLNPILIKDFNNHKIDCLAIHGEINQIKIGIHYIHKSIYKKLCQVEPISIFLGRDSSASVNHQLNGFKNSFLSTEILHYEDPYFLYEYNHNIFEAGDYVPKIYHLMIMNSVFINCKDEIQLLRKELLIRMNGYCEHCGFNDPLQIFMPRLNEWNIMYKDFMLNEIMGENFEGH
ncbi:MAG: hypothetical protein WC915_05435 [archaeon]|jgi:hypothetical protein